MLKEIIKWALNEKEDVVLEILDNVMPMIAYLIIVASLVILLLMLLACVLNRMGMTIDPYKTGCKSDCNGDDVNFAIYLDASTGYQDSNEEDIDTSLISGAISVFAVAIFICCFGCVCMKQYLQQRRRDTQHQITINATAEILAISTPPPRYEELDFTSRPRISITINNSDRSGDTSPSERTPVTPPPSYEDVFENMGGHVQEMDLREEDSEERDVEQTISGPEVFMSSMVSEDEDDEQRSVGDEQTNVHYQPLREEVSIGDDNNVAGEQPHINDNQITGNNPDISSNGQPIVNIAETHLADLPNAEDRMRDEESVCLNTGSSIPVLETEDQDPAPESSVVVEVNPPSGVSNTSDRRETPEDHDSSQALTDSSVHSGFSCDQIYYV